MVHHLKPFDSLAGGKVIEMNKQEQLNVIKRDFIDSQKVLLAIGDETRQAILLVLMETECQTGLRVGEITETNTPFSTSCITSS